MGNRKCLEIKLKKKKLKFWQSVWRVRRWSPSDALLAKAIKICWGKKYPLHFHPSSECLCCHLDPPQGTGTDTLLGVDVAGMSMSDDM